MKKIILFLSALTILFISCGCTKVSKGVPYDPSLDSSIADSGTEGQPDSTTVAPVKANVPVVEASVGYTKQLQAESGVTAGDLRLNQTRQGYSGAGYISGFNGNPNNKLTMSLKIPVSQHYNISLIVASDAKQTNILSINDAPVAEFTTTGTGKFENVIVKNVYIPKGTIKLGITQNTGNIDVDFIQVQNSSDVSGISLSASPTLTNPDADIKTVNTMKYLCENYGKNVLSGQYATPGSDKELQLIYQVTGKYPAIRLGDLSPYTQSNNVKPKEIEKAIDWSEKGGMVSYVWHWDAPMNESSSYATETAFDLSKAVTTENIACLSQDEIQKLHSENKISDETVAIIKDIDVISLQLQRLQDKGVTVIWRPLSEASGGWFWWGSKGADAYKWLWELLYARQTHFHKLNNLIWVWNAQDAGWYVGDDKCDIISADVYSDMFSFNSQVNTFVQLQKISNKKLIALSECAAPPLTDNMLRDKAMWSWFGVWSGGYVIDENGALIEDYVSRQQLINIYNHENVITREKLPDFKASGN